MRLRRRHDWFADFIQELDRSFEATFGDRRGLNWQSAASELTWCVWAQTPGGDRRTPPVSLPHNFSLHSPRDIAQHVAARLAYYAAEYDRDARTIPA